MYIQYEHQTANLPLSYDDVHLLLSQHIPHNTVHRPRSAGSSCPLMWCTANITMAIALNKLGRAGRPFTIMRYVLNLLHVPVSPPPTALQRVSREQVEAPQLHSRVRKRTSACSLAGASRMRNSRRLHPGADSVRGRPRRTPALRGLTLRGSIQTHDTS